MTDLEKQIAEKCLDQLQFSHIFYNELGTVSFDRRSATYVAASQMEHFLSSPHVFERTIQKKMEIFIEAYHQLTFAQSFFKQLISRFSGSHQRKMVDRISEMKSIVDQIEILFAANGYKVIKEQKTITKKAAPKKDKNWFCRMLGI